MTDWASDLIAAARRDLETRARLVKTGELFNGYHPEMEAIHLENAALLDRAFDELGWPSRAKITDDGAAAATLVLQHAIGSPALQRRGLELMLAAVETGDANALDAAYLSDRIAVLEGRPQLFGTQFDWDRAGLLSPAPIDDPGRVDERRASVGLAPMAETIAGMRAQAAAEGETAPSDYATRRAEYDAWARKAGWRA